MRDGWLILLFAISIICNTYFFISAIPVFRDNVSVIKATVFGTIGYFFVYTAVSAILITAGFFSVEKTVLITLAVSLLSVIFSVIKFKLSPFKKIKFDKKELIFFLSIILVSLVLGKDKFGFYGMGQDQGVYQTKAAEFVFDNNSNEYNFDYAFAAFEDREDFTNFRNQIKKLQGYYLLGQNTPTYADPEDGGMTGLEGVYHGLPTWASIMALFGKMFGLSHMQDVQTVFFICFIMMAFYILENFKIKTVCEIASVTVLAFSPIVVWVSKSALTEMFLAVIVATYIYLLCHENKNARLFMWIPVAVFSVYHVSAYTMMPLFVFTGWMNLFADKRKRAVLPALLIPVSFQAGFLFSLENSELYTVINFLKPLSKFITAFKTEDYSDDTLAFTAVSAAVLACIIITLILYIILRYKKISGTFEKAGPKNGLIVKISSLLVFAFVIFEYVKSNGSFTLDPLRNIVSISVASGFVSLLLILIGLLLVKSEKIKDTPVLFMFPAFWYLLVWCVMFKPYINYFFYYGRYDVPYVIIPIVFLCVLYRDFERTDWIPAVCAASVFVYLNYDVYLVKNQDDTKVAWDVIEIELEDERLQNSAVVINDDFETMLEWFFLVKASGAEVFPMEKDFDAQTERLLQTYDNVYFMYEYNAEAGSREETQFSDDTFSDDFYVLQDTSDLIDASDISEIGEEETRGIESITDKDFELIKKYLFTRSEDTSFEADSWTGYPESFETAQRILEIHLLRGGN
ncbi:MAG: hypothetical protein K5776_10535 [Lachnospiraceae bacterium]|nr:hypothetical protein [Lachnospiraceae bacterium]